MRDPPSASRQGWSSQGLTWPAPHLLTHFLDRGLRVGGTGAAGALSPTGPHTGHTALRRDPRDHLPTWVGHDPEMRGTRQREVS